MSKIPENLAVARYIVSDKIAPYLSRILWSLIPVEKVGLGTVGVDKYFRLYYDPEVITNKWTPQELAVVLIHECGHLLRGHHRRFESLTNVVHKVANIAGDCEINDDLAREGQRLPKDSVYPSTFQLPDNALMEWYYQELMKNAKVVTITPSPNCGSCATGVKQPHEDDAPTGEKGEKSPGISEVEGDLLVKEALKEISQRGDVPAGLKRFAEASQKSVVDWRKQLAVFVRRAIGDAAGAVDYSWKRPSRRSDDILLPILRRPIPKVVVVADTSGSMGQKDLDIIVREVGALLGTIGFQGVPFLATDADVHTHNTVFTPSQIDLRGGGGTDMRVGIEAAHKLKPDLCVVLTDCETPWPSAPIHNMKVLVVVTRGNGEGVPEWMKKVIVLA